MVMGELSFLAFDGSGCVLPVMSDFVTLWKESPRSPSFKGRLVF